MNLHTVVDSAALGVAAWLLRTIDERKWSLLDANNNEIRLDDLRPAVKEALMGYLRRVLTVIGGPDE